MLLQKAWTPCRSFPVWPWIIVALELRRSLDLKRSARNPTSAQIELWFWNSLRIAGAGSGGGAGGGGAGFVWLLLRFWPSKLIQCLTLRSFRINQTRQLGFSIFIWIVIPQPFDLDGVCGRDRPTWDENPTFRFCGSYWKARNERHLLKSICGLLGILRCYWPLLQSRLQRQFTFERSRFALLVLVAVPILVLVLSKLLWDLLYINAPPAAKLAPQMLYWFPDGDVVL